MIKTVTFFLNGHRRNHKNLRKKDFYLELALYICTKMVILKIYFWVFLKSNSIFFPFISFIVLFSLLVRFCTFCSILGCYHARNAFCFIHTNLKKFVFIN